MFLFWVNDSHFPTLASLTSHCLRSCPTGFSTVCFSTSSFPQLDVPAECPGLLQPLPVPPQTHLLLRTLLLGTFGHYSLNCYLCVSVHFCAYVCASVSLIFLPCGLNQSIPATWHRQCLLDVLVPWPAPCSTQWALYDCCLEVCGSCEPFAM